jgi:hypothetical protein
MERDRSLLTVASGGLGLLVSVLALSVKRPSAIQVVLYLIAFAAFLTTILAVIVIFDRNAAYIRRLLAGDPTHDRLLGILDRLAEICFMLGIVSFMCVGVVTLFTRP